MHIPYVVSSAPFRLSSDVAATQPVILANCAYPQSSIWDIVSKGRTQAAEASHRGLNLWAVPRAALQEYRSRGCLRARKLCWPSAWSLSSQPAPRKKPKSSMLTNRFRPSRPTPASTSNLFGRAVGFFPARPARFAAPNLALMDGGAAC